MTGSRWTRVVLLGAVAVGAAACGEIEPQGVRGYTKPPLAVPGPFLKTEPVTEMARLGEPNLPAQVIIEVEDTAVTKTLAPQRSRR